MSQGLLSANGSQAQHASRWAPILTSSFFTGFYSNASPLNPGGASRQEEKYYGSRTEGMISPSLNVELSVRNTPIRRPGCSTYSQALYTSVDGFSEFRLFDTNTEKNLTIISEASGVYADDGTTSTLIFNKAVGAGLATTQYVANILYVTDGSPTNQYKWVQSPTGWKSAYNYLTLDGMQTYFVDPNGNLQQLTECVIPVVNIAIVANNLVVTYNQDVTKILSAGLDVTFAGLTSAAFLNNETDQTLTIASVAGATATIPYIASNYASTADSGTCRVLEGGNPLTSVSQPVWNITLMGTTTDNTAIWTNRGTTLENYGIEPPSQDAINVNVGVSSQSWKPDTYYSPLSAIIDSNGNLQATTTSGKSSTYGTNGSGHPTWNTTVGSTTTDGTVTWTLTKTAAQMLWAPATQYQTGSIIVATPAGGVPSVFQVQGYEASQLSGNVEAYLWPVPTTGAVGVFQKPSGTTLSSAAAHATGNSLLFDGPGSGGTQPLKWSTLDSSGATTGYTTPFPGYSTDYNLVVLANLSIPAPGNYTVTIAHHDGMIWGIGNGATPVSGPHDDPLAYATTAVNGYTIMGGTNRGLEGGQVYTENFVVNFPTAGVFPIEIDYAYWYHSGQILTFLLNGNTPVPGTTPTNRTSGPSAPNWPVFSTAYAPGYATVSESAGQLVWANIGAVTDFAWTSKTNYLTDATSIVDNNGYTQAAFESGVTTQVAPTFSQTLNAITPDNPNLIWINKGKATIIPAGSVSTYDGGWSYCLALVNTLTDTVSNAGPVTITTGSFLGASGVTLTGGLPDASLIDPQVDYVAIFRTKDGGATYYLIPSTATLNSNQNTVYTMPLAQYLANGFVDTVPDGDLNILIQAPLNGENTVPPTGIINLAYHLQRIFGSVGNQVFWSAGPDTPVGNGNEGFPPINSATFPSLVKRIVPTSVGALVFTVSDIYLIAGKGTTNSPLFPQSFADGYGLLSYNALAVNGTTIYMMTTDRQVVRFVPGGEIEEVGFGIGDQFDNSNWNPANAYLTWHKDGTSDTALYVGDGSTGWFRMTVMPQTSTGVAWAPFARIVGGCSAVRSVEIQPGVRKLLIGSTATPRPILKRDRTLNTDNGVSYPAFFTIGSLVLATPGQIAEVAFITFESKLIGSAPVPSVLMGEISGTFETMPLETPDPPLLPASASLYSQRFYLSQTQEPAICRHMQLKVTWPTEAAANELLTMTIFGCHAQES